MPFCQPKISIQLGFQPFALGALIFYEAWHANFLVFVARKNGKQQFY